MRPSSRRQWQLKSRRHPSIVRLPGVLGQPSKPCTAGTGGEPTHRHPSIMRFPGVLDRHFAVGAAGSGARRVPHCGQGIGVAEEANTSVCARGPTLRRARQWSGGSGGHISVLGVPHFGQGIGMAGDTCHGIAVQDLLPQHLGQLLCKHPRHAPTTWLCAHICSTNPAPPALVPSVPLAACPQRCPHNNPSKLHPPAMVPSALAVSSMSGPPGVSLARGSMAVTALPCAPLQHQ